MRSKSQQKKYSPECAIGKASGGSSPGRRTTLMNGKNDLERAFTRRQIGAMRVICTSKSRGHKCGTRGLSTFIATFRIVEKGFCDSGRFNCC
ncbi:uncharacterized protein EpC_32510 [Erwinia pyrifoliae Ep1/96]|nr:uncharacterized protein EpC_32510 [Erwinia pyrifoliae Ep1/96]